MFAGRKMSPKIKTEVRRNQAGYCMPSAGDSGCDYQARLKTADDIAKANISHKFGDQRRF